MSKTSIILELRSGAGGEESKIFVSDIARMYNKFCIKNNFEYNLLESTIHGAIVKITGENAYNLLKNEGGVHRVQRIPSTEKRGRVQTSTITIAALESDLGTVEKLFINPKDLEITKCHSSGPGGQNVNKVESAVRIKYLPTNLTVFCQQFRSQLQNKEAALEILYLKLLQQQKDMNQKTLVSIRKEQVKNGNRCDKIRTYDYQKDLLIDHRINKKFSVTKAMDGNLLPLLQELQNI